MLFRSKVPISHATHCVSSPFPAPLRFNHTSHGAILTESIADGARTSWSASGVSTSSPSTDSPPAQRKFRWAQPPLLGNSPIPKHERVPSGIPSQHSISPRPTSLHSIPAARFISPSASWTARWDTSYPGRANSTQRLIGGLDRFRFGLEPQYAPSYALQRSSATYGFQCLPPTPSRGRPSS